MTSLGLTAIAVRCKQLSKLDIKKCSNIDDTGMIPLAYFSQNLRQVNFQLHCFYGIPNRNLLLGMLIATLLVD